MSKEYYGIKVAEAVKAAAGLGPESVVVDVGAGTGFLTLALAPGVGRALAVDQSDHRLVQVRAKAAELGLENIGTRKGGLSALPLADGTADAVVANMVLHHAGDPPAAIREMARLLKPDGRLILTDFDQRFDRTDLTGWLEAAGLEPVSADSLGANDCLFMATGARKAHRLQNSTGCLICGRQNPIGLKVQFWASGNRVWAPVSPGEHFQGFNGVLHGGVISALMDDSLWYAIHNATGQMTMTVDLNIRFKKSAPVGTDLVAAGELVSHKGRLSEARAVLYLASGEVVAEATGKFLSVPEKQARELGGSW